MLALAFLFWRQSLAPEQAQANGLLAGLLLAVLVGAYELLVLRVHHNPSTGLAMARPLAFNMQRTLIKINGLLLSLAPLAGAYWLFPEYHGSFYEHFWQALKTYGLAMLILAPFYMAWVDARMAQPQDSYYHLGRAPFQTLSPVEWQAVAKHYGGWIVKGFFLPLMTAYIGNEVNGVWAAWGNINSIMQQYGGYWPALQQQKLGYYPFELLFHFGYTVDLLFCVVGYACTLRIIDAHIRSPQPRALGWLVAVACYQPFYSIISNQYLHYDDNVAWDNWLYGMPIVKFAWASAILALLSIYCLSTVAFGLRFSNLTNRGLITHGPYRYSKHPAYLSKNLSWWLISVPFIASVPSEALSNCAHLALINLIYYWRAKTEEQHLAEEAGYAAYTQYIQQHGLLAKLFRMTK